jgi:hypothetical protein
MEAAMAVTAFLQKTAAEQSHDHRRHALHLELARLDQLQATYYPAALAGDLAAAAFVLKIMLRRWAIIVQQHLARAGHLHRLDAAVR